jgi:hypothetical protein
MEKIGFKGAQTSKIFPGKTLAPNGSVGARQLDDEVASVPHVEFRTRRSNI